jgi:hypothetical protein
VNVLGDAIGAGIVYHLSKKELEKMDQHEEDKAKESYRNIDSDAIEMTNEIRSENNQCAENGRGHANKSYASD